MMIRYRVIGSNQEGSMKVHTFVPKASSGGMIEYRDGLSLPMLLTTAEVLYDADQDRALRTDAISWAQGVSE